jgi:hypothetical protein
MEWLYSWKTWILFAPQYHALMLLLVLVCLGLLVGIYRRVRQLHTQQILVCPVCKHKTLVTYQKCGTCKLIRWR